MKAIEQRRRMKGQQGFTLVELLIVIAILGILAAVVVFAVGNVTGNAQSAACDIEERTLKTAIQAYRSQNNGALPPNLAALEPEWLEDAGDVATRWDYDAGDITGIAACS